MPSVDNLNQDSNIIPQKYQPPTHVSTSFTWTQWGNHVCIAGSFDPPVPTWTPIEMKKDSDNVNKVNLDLLPNKKYQYKFVVDGNWVLDPTTSSYPDASGNYNHEIQVELPPPPPLPLEEEKDDVVEDQQVEQVEIEQEIVADENKEHYQEDHKDQHQCEEDVIAAEEQNVENQEDQVVTEEQKGNPQEEEQKVEHQQDQVAAEEQEIEQQADQAVNEEQNEHPQEEVAAEEQKGNPQEDEQKVEHQQDQVAAEEQEIEQQADQAVNEEQNEHPQEEVAAEEQKGNPQEEEQKVEHQQDQVAAEEQKIEQQADQAVNEEQNEHPQEEVAAEEQKGNPQEEEQKMEHQQDQVAAEEQKIEQQADQAVNEEQKEYHQEDDVITEEQKGNPQEDEQKVEHQQDQVAVEEQKIEQQADQAVNEEQNEHSQEEVAAEEQKIEYQEDQVVNEGQNEYYQEIATEEQKIELKEDQSVTEEQNEHPQEEVAAEEQKTEYQEDQSVTEEQNEHPQEEVAAEEQKTEYQEDQVVNEGQKEHYQEIAAEEQKIELKEDQSVTEEQNEHPQEEVAAEEQKPLYQEDQVAVGEQKNISHVVEEICSESTVTDEKSSIESSEVVHTEQLHDNSMVTTETEIITTETTIKQETVLSNEPTSSDINESSSTVKETIIESDNEKLSAEYVANKEHDTGIQTEFKEPLPEPVNVSEEVNITEKQTKDETTISNQDDGVSSITCTDVSGLISSKVEVPEDIINDNKGGPTIEQSVIVEQAGSEESKVTEFIAETSSVTNENNEQIVNITTKETISSDSTTDVDSTSIEFESHSTEAIMPSEINYEELYEPELDPINEGSDDNLEDEDIENYDKEDEYIEDVTETYPENLSPDVIKEVLLNHTWAKDDLIEESIPSAWLDTSISSNFVWPEDINIEWSDVPNKEQVTSTWSGETVVTRTISEKTETTDKPEHVIETQSREIPSTILVNTEQVEIPSSTSISENLESTIVEENTPQSIVDNNESHVEHKTREIIVKETIVEDKTKEPDGETGKERLIIKEHTISTSEVKENIVAEPSSVVTAQYEKPESSATADEKISIPTTVATEPVIDEAVLKVIEKLKLIENQENYEEAAQSILAGVNLPGKISPRKNISISPNMSSPGESTRNADLYVHNINVATNTSRSPTKGTINKKSKHKPVMITSRGVIHSDSKYVQQHVNPNEFGFDLIYLVTSVATTFFLGIISMGINSVFGTKKNK